MYSGVPKKCPPGLFFFQNYSNPQLLLNFLLCDSNLQAIWRKKYLLSKKVFSKASLKILEVNIHAQWSA